MKFKLKLTSVAQKSLNSLKKDDPKKHKKVLKTLGFMEVNLRHPSLNTHKYESMRGPNDEEIFEAYVENKTPAAFRVFWYYGSNRDELTILAITPHP